MNISSYLTPIGKLIGKVACKIKILFFAFGKDNRAERSQIEYQIQFVLQTSAILMSNLE